MGADKTIWKKWEIDFKLFLRTPFFTEHFRWLLLKEDMENCNFASIYKQNVAILPMEI